MSVSVITTNETFFEWLTKTNQLINQYDETNTLAVNAFNTSNSVTFTAANVAANVLSTNLTFRTAVVTEVANSSLLINSITSNTVLANNIYTNANTAANVAAVGTVRSAAYLSDLSNLIITEGSLTATVIANTTLTNQIYTNANSLAQGFNSNSNLGQAWVSANTAHAKANASLLQANTARDHANAAFLIANLSFATANTGGSAGNSALLQANTARDHANAAFAKANTGSTGTTVTLFNDSVNVVRYPVFANTTSGNVTNLNVASTRLTFNPSTGTLSATVFNSLSDENQKEDIRIIENAVGKVQSLKGVQFNFKETGAASAGILAQDLIKVLPELVSSDMSVNYSGVIGLLIEAIKELNQRISDLENK